MSKTKILWVIVSAVLIVGGMMMALAALAMLDFDVTGLTTEQAVSEKTYTVKEPFDNILVNTDTQDVRFVPADDGICRVQCYETDKLTYTVAVQNGSLTVTLTDNRRWYDYIGIFLCDQERALTVYLPKTSYAALTVETDTSDIVVPNTFSFEQASIDTDTGDIAWAADVTQTLLLGTDTGDVCVESATVGALDLETDTGDITVKTITVNGEVCVETSTGDTEFAQVSCGTLNMQSSTGDITLAHTVASERLDIVNNTGDVALEQADAASLHIVTSTGDVTGTLCSDKVFVTETSTGHIEVPRTAAGGLCEVSTSTGDIALNIV